MKWLTNQTKLMMRLIAVVFALLTFACNSKQETKDQESFSDTAAIAAGNQLFIDNCSSCHNFREGGIGPQLGGITTIASEQYIKDFIRNPKAVIESGDPRALIGYKKFKSIMPAFAHLSDADLDNLYAYLSTQRLTGRGDLIDPKALQDPIPDTISMSDILVDVEPVSQIPASAQEGQLTRICKIDFRPDTKDLYVVDLRGKLFKLQNGKPRLYLDMAKERPKFIEKPGLATGFGSFAFHPEFDRNGLLYTTHTESSGSAPADFVFDDSIKVTLQWVLTEWNTTTPNAVPFKGEGRELMRINMAHQFHGVQEITFNPLAKAGDEDYGLLYIGIGDGGSVEFGYPFLVHSTERIWGTIIRIDPAGNNSSNGKYGIPSTNPFASNSSQDVVREIYAYGFRNPHRITWTKKGEMICSNIGHHNIESLYMVLPGRDHGWPIREGTFLVDLEKGMNNNYPLPANDKELNINYPIAQYDHDEGNAISGGQEYTGAIAELKDKYLFGDVVNGRLFYIETKNLQPGKQKKIFEWQISVNGKRKTLRELSGADKVDVRFGKDHKGEFYILTKPDGKIYRLKKVIKTIS